MLRRRDFVIAVALILPAAVGCGSAADPVVNLAKSPPEEKPVDAAAKTAKTNDDIPDDIPKATFAFLPNNDAEFWIFARRGVEQFAKETGEACIVRAPKGADAKEQRDLIERLLEGGVKGIAVCPKDAKAMSEFLGEVNKKVPVLTVDIDIPDAAARRAFLGTNDYLAGRAAGELVGKASPGGGKIALFVGRLETPNAIERRQGVLDQLAGLDRKAMGQPTPPDAVKLKVGKHLLLSTRTDGGSGDACRKQCESLLAKDPDAAALVGLWAYNAPQLVLAAHQKKSKAAIVAFDEADETLAAIQDGKVVGTVVKNPYELGYQSMKLLQRLAAGDSGAIAEHPQSVGSNRIEFPSRVIDRASVAEFRAKCKEMLGK